MQAEHFHQDDRRALTYVAGVCRNIWAFSSNGDPVPYIDMALAALDAHKRLATQYPEARLLRCCLAAWRDAREGLALPRLFEALTELHRQLPELDVVRELEQRARADANKQKSINAAAVTVGAGASSEETLSALRAVGERAADIAWALCVATDGLQRRCAAMDLAFEKRFPFRLAQAVQSSGVNWPARVAESAAANSKTKDD